MLARLWLPVALAAACIGAWVLSDRLGDLSVESAAATGDTPAQTGLATPMTSVRRLPQIATTSLRDQRIELALASIPEPPTPLSCATVMIDGEVVHEVRGDAPLVPGFAQLLVTGHVALELLGPSHRFETRVMAADRPTEQGGVLGDLYLVGGGDPVLMTYGYSRGFRPIHTTRTPFEDLVTSLVDVGVTRVEGGVVGVERRYDRERAPGWPSTYVDAGVSGPLSALQLDDGFVRRPSFDGSGAVPAEQPAELAAARFRDELERAEVTVVGAARADVEEDEIGDLVPLTSVTSPALSDIVWQMWAVNDASAAEMLMKEIGLQFAGDGSSAAGGEAVQLTLSQQGVTLDAPPRDGSGLDPASTFSCRLLADTMRTIPADHPTRALMPTPSLPGVYGGALADATLEAEVRLVGGVVGDTAGFVATTFDDGREVVIASIVNRSGGPDDRDTAFHRALLEQIDGLRLAWADVSITDGDDG